MSPLLAHLLLPACVPFFSTLSYIPRPYPLSPQYIHLLSLILSTFPILL